ncbi:FAD:protein FMN transferase [Pseudaquabacterium pictum]|uniref:FAD:protein FMN transferase n=1 Tax=Pseudaquabacterium pictum TaxID=2315236 RepID=A0A480AQ61_9BURK|nr:FAD:protein FMN transferase [Rubrivivax pictus]GCL62940.1 FAD:protein FMN transferase [Rubrivivax pictus]
MSGTRRQWLRCAFGLGAALGAGLGMAATGLQWRERALLGFGTTLWLRAGHADGGRADAALDTAVARLRHLEAQCSLFNPASALCRLNHDGQLDDPDPALVDLLRQAQAVSARCQGAFDVTVQPLWAAWQQASGAGRVPTPAELAAARARVDWRALQVAPRRIRLVRPDMAVTLNGIAQGYAADLARQVLQQHGIGHALLDTGEWAPLGQSPDGQPWQLGLADPRDSARLLRQLQAGGRGIAVSTDATLRFGASHRDHHILDPRSGRSPPHLAAAVVAAPSTTLADALTKVLFMGTPAQALAQARRWGVDVVVVDKAGRVQASAGWG